MGNKETLEQAAERLHPIDISDHDSTSMIEFDCNLQNRNAFIDGAKWKQEISYSEEDMRECFFYAISQTGEGWNGEYPGSNYGDVEYEFKETWLEFIKSKNGTK